MADLRVLTACMRSAGDEPEVSEAQAIAGVVEKRLDSLDEFFIHTVAAFEQGAREGGDASLAGAGSFFLISLHIQNKPPWALRDSTAAVPVHAARLGAIQREVLAQVAARLPAELRLLEDLQRLLSRSASVVLLRWGILGGSWYRLNAYHGQICPSACPTYYVG
jgi:hypothetical protein